jgi:hypothetical protein
VKGGRIVGEQLMRVLILIISEGMAVVGFLEAGKRHALGQRGVIVALLSGLIGVVGVAMVSLFQGMAMVK